VWDSTCRHNNFSIIRKQHPQSFEIEFSTAPLQSISGWCSCSNSAFSCNAKPHVQSHGLMLVKTAQLLKLILCSMRFCPRAVRMFLLLFVTAVIEQSYSNIQKQFDETKMYVSTRAYCLVSACWIFNPALMSSTCAICQTRKQHTMIYYCVFVFCRMVRARSLCRSSSAQMKPHTHTIVGRCTMFKWCSWAVTKKVERAEKQNAWNTHTCTCARWQAQNSSRLSEDSIMGQQKQNRREIIRNKKQARAKTIQRPARFVATIMINTQAQLYTHINAWLIFYNFTTTHAFSYYTQIHTRTRKQKVTNKKYLKSSKTYPHHQKVQIYFMKLPISYLKDIHKLSSHMSLFTLHGSSKQWCMTEKRWRGVIYMFASIFTFHFIWPFIYHQNTHTQQSRKKQNQSIAWLRLRPCIYLLE